MSKIRTISLPLLAAWSVCSSLSTRGLEARALPVPPETQAPMEKLAQRAAHSPFKLDIRPLTQSAQLGGRVSVEIVLLDAANRRVVSNQKSDLRVEVTVTGPSKKVKTYQVFIKPGANVGTLEFEPRETGVLSLKAREVNDTLLPGGNSVLVRKPVSFRPVPLARPVSLLAVAFHVEEPHRQVVAGELSEPEPRQATLLLQDSTGREILADGKDSARIQVYFVDPRGAAAPADIKVWLTWSNGQLTPQPLTIKKGDFFAEAQWISRSPVENATVSIASRAPTYPIDGASDHKVTFAPPIHTIGFLTPNPLSLSLVDYAPIQVGFFTLADDGTLKPITTSKVRRVTLTPLNGLLRVNPLQGDVQRNESGIPFYVSAAWFGASALQVSTPDYPSQKLDVQVTVLLVVILCIGGGALGGLAAKQSLQAAFLWRVFVGILGAIGLVWFSVFAAPQTLSSIAHSLVSVFVVGIVGGYGGTRVLDFLGKKLGYL